MHLKTPKSVPVSGQVLTQGWLRLDSGQEGSHWGHQPGTSPSASPGGSLPAGSVSDPPVTLQGAVLGKKPVTWHEWLRATSPVTTRIVPLLGRRRPTAANWRRAPAPQRGLSHLPAGAAQPLTCAQVQLAGDSGDNTLSLCLLEALKVFPSLCFEGCALPSPFPASGPC